MGSQQWGEEGRRVGEYESVKVESAQKRVAGQRLVEGMKVGGQETRRDKEIIDLPRRDQWEIRRDERERKRRRN